MGRMGTRVIQVIHPIVGSIPKRCTSAYNVLRLFQLAMDTYSCKC